MDVAGVLMRSTNLLDLEASLLSSTGEERAESSLKSSSSLNPSNLEVSCDMRWSEEPGKLET